MRAVILAGGKGTRLRPLTVYTPKPIVPVVNRPFLLYQVEILKRAGIDDITLSLNYQPDKILHLLGDGSEYGVNLTYVTESSPLGTAGAYRYAAGDSNEPIIVLNGDILTDLIVKNLIDRHSESKNEATICLAHVEDPTKYGAVDIDTKGRVKQFREKPKPKDVKSKKDNLINAGIYVLESNILKMIPEDQNYSFEYEVFPEILERKMKFGSYVFNGEYWCDIGTPEKYLAAHHDFLKGDVRRFDLPKRSETAEIATSSKIDPRSVIGDRCEIKPGVIISNSVIGEGAHIEEKAVIENSVVWPHTRIANSAEIHGSIIAKSCYVGKNVHVSEGTVLGDKTSLTDYTRV